MSEVKQKLRQSGYRWDDQMIGMLGKEFKILAVGHLSNSNIIALPSPDGSQDGKWYFPYTVFYQSGNEVLYWTIQYVRTLYFFGMFTASDIIHRLLLILSDPKRSKENGKHYCGYRLDGPRCNCCNGYCGPTNGCNCSSCMQLDIKGLPRGTLVNRHGSTSSRSNETGQLYCGMKVMVGEPDCDGYCGPTNGPNCNACQILQSQANSRYTKLECN